MNIEHYKGFATRSGTLDKYVVDELRSYAKFFECLKPWDCVLDIGGNIGTVAKTCAQMGCSVVSFEPFVENFELLNQNIKGLRVMAFNSALVNGTQENVKFYVNKGKNQGSHSQYVKRGRKEVTVSAYNIKALRWDQITAVKIDAEGAEYDLMPEILELGTRVKVITAELHLGKKEWREHKAPALLKKMKQLGWVAYKEPASLEKNFHVTGVWLHAK